MGLLDSHVLALLPPAVQRPGAGDGGHDTALHLVLERDEGRVAVTAH